LHSNEKSKQMEQVTVEKELTPLEKKIAQLRAETEEKLNKDIEELILSEKVIEARETLDKTIKDLIADYEQILSKYQNPNQVNLLYLKNVN
jgi:hypothetical protein